MAPSIAIYLQFPSSPTPIPSPTLLYQCVVNACVKSNKKECACKALMTKKSCGKCEKSKKVKSGTCAGVKTCQPIAAEDCPKMGSPNCPPCQKPVVESGKEY